MLADDFMRFIALEAVCAGVPTGDDAGRVEHVNGIVRYGLYQEAVTSVLRLGNTETARAVHCCLLSLTLLARRPIRLPLMHLTDWQARTFHDLYKLDPCR